MKFTLGCDPELFMADQQGQLRAACGRIGGTKEKPQAMGIGDGFFVQEDNVAIEFNIPPAHNAAMFKESIGKAIESLQQGIQSMYGFQIVNLSAAPFPKGELEHPASRVFGCDPDYNAWTGRKNPRPSSVDETLRSCGGHVHVGYADKKIVSPVTLIKAMDLYLGVPSVLMDRGELRKELYGMAGAFRNKPYGVEYRTLSNFWVFSDQLKEWVWNNTARAMQAVEDGLIDFSVEQAAIQHAINRNDVVMAHEMVKRHNLEVVHV
jgi:hypothetical protein